MALGVFILGINSIGQSLNNLLEHNSHLLGFIHNGLGSDLNFLLEL